MAVPLKFTEYFKKPEHWVEHELHYEDLYDAIGPAIQGSTKTFSKIRDDTVALAKRSPLAFALLTDRNKILIGHSLDLLPSNPCKPNPDLDGKPVMLFGNDIESCTALVLDPEAFRTASYNVQTLAHIAGPDMHGHDPVIVHAGPYDIHADGITSANARKILVIPSDLVDAVLTSFPTGQSDMRYFYTTMFSFLSAPEATEDDREAMEVLTDWFRAASLTQGGDFPLRTLAHPGLDPAQGAVVNAWRASRVRQVTTLLGYGGPSLSAATFNHGMTQIETAIAESTQKRIDYDKATSNKSFREKHGEALLELLYKFTGQTNEVDLPQIHKLLVAAPKNREYGILQSTLAARAGSTTLPIATHPTG